MIIVGLPSVFPGTVIVFEVFFVPPVYDAQQPDGHFKTTEREISLATHLSPLTSKKMSQDLQLWLFHQYQLLNARGEVKDLVDIWQSYYSRPKLRQKFPLPPGGTETAVPPNCCSMPISRA